MTRSFIWDILCFFLFFFLAFLDQRGRCGELDDCATSQKPRKNTRNFSFVCFRFSDRFESFSDRFGSFSHRFFVILLSLSSWRRFRKKLRRMFENIHWGDPGGRGYNPNPKPWVITFCALAVGGWPVGGRKCLLAMTEMSSSQDRNVF